MNQHERLREWLKGPPRAPTGFEALVLLTEYDALCKALRNCVDSLEYVNQSCRYENGRPIVGYGVRAERIAAALAALAKAGTP